ncbi:MAG: pentapeptide repeat-containing protein [Roseobacter sp.]
MSREGQPRKEGIWKAYASPRIKAACDAYEDTKGSELQHVSVDSTKKLGDVDVPKFDATRLRSFLAGGSKDLNFADLSGLNLSGMNLAGVDLTGASLMSVRFSNRTKMLDANLSGARFDKRSLRSFLGAGFKKLNGANLSGLDLSGMNLRSVDLSNVDLQGVTFSKYTKLENTHFRGALIDNTSLRSFLGAGFKKLSGADLKGVDLSGRDLRELDLSNATLSGVAFSRDTKLKGTNLIGASFDKASLGSFLAADFKNLQHVNLPETMRDLPPKRCWHTQFLERIRALFSSGI